MEVILPIMFILLATTMFLLNRRSKQTQSCKWFIAALVLVGLIRLNQASYAWFQIENTHQYDIIGAVILKPLVLGSWLMAWWEWFDLHQPKWIPRIIAILSLLFMATQLLGLSWVSSSFYTYFQTVSDYMRLVFLALLMFIIYQGIRIHGVKNLLVLLAILLVTIALYPTEVSELHIIPGIWFPYGVGVSRAQYFYVFFVFVMYIILIQQNRKVRLE